jgi:hypothetical protein
VLDFTLNHCKSLGSVPVLFLADHRQLGWPIEKMDRHQGNGIVFSWKIELAALEPVPISRLPDQVEFKT